MTPTAGSKILVAKRPLTVVAGCAILPPPSTEVHDRRRCRNLASPRRAGPSGMAAIAAQPLVAAVDRVAKVGRQSANAPATGTRGPGFVTCAARGYIPALELSVRAMTLEASRVRICASWHRERRTGACLPVAIGTIRMRSMPRMIKLRVERAKRRKRPHCPGNRFRMTDRAYLSLRVFKMLHVATCTWDMACEFHMRGIVLANVADQAWQSCVLLVLVVEFRVVGVGKIKFYLRRLRFGRLHCRNIMIVSRRLRSARDEIERCGKNSAN